MKHSNLIRILSGLSFLIFFCPFFEMCSYDASQFDAKTGEYSQSQRIDITLNEYDLAFEGIANITDGEFISGFLPFTIILVLTVTAFIKSFDAVQAPIRFYSYFNLLLLLAFQFLLFVIFPISVFIFEVRYGFYLFAVNSIFIIILCKRQYNSIN